VGGRGIFWEIKNPSGNYLGIKIEKNSHFKGVYPVWVWEGGGE
jgi:hypothetical protein